MNKVVDDLKQYGTVQRALLGITGGDVRSWLDRQKEEGKEIDLGTNEGIYVNEVQENSAGEEAKLEKGDVITSVDGKKVSKMAELQELLAGKRPGDKITITYLRNKKQTSKTVTLKNAQGNTKVVKEADLDILGVNFKEITEDQKTQLNIAYGLEVSKVAAGAFKEAGIGKGFIIREVNDQPVKTVDQLQDIVRQASTSKEPVLYIKGIWPTGKRGYFAVQLDE